MARLLPCDLEVMGSNPQHSLFTCEYKAAYIYCLHTPPGGKSCAFFISIQISLIFLDIITFVCEQKEQLNLLSNGYGGRTNLQKLLRGRLQRLQSHTVAWIVREKESF